MYKRGFYKVKFLFLFVFLFLLIFTEYNSSEVNTSTVMIKSAPIGAHVYIDGKDTKNITPFVCNLEVGKHIIKLMKNYYKEWDNIVDITANQYESINVTLESSNLNIVEVIRDFIFNTESWRCWDGLSTLFIFISTLLAFFTTIYVIYQLFLKISRPRYEQVQNYLTFFTNQYLDGSIKFESKDKEKEITFKEIRLRVENRYKIDRKKWKSEKDKNDFYSFSKQDFTLENKFTYRISIVLNRIGISVLSGILPLEMILALNGPQILQDWEYCRELIKGKISYNLYLKEDKDRLFNFSRRYFLWLACASSLYSYKKIKKIDKQKNITQEDELKRIFDRKDLNIIELIKLNDKIMRITEKSDARIIPRLVKSDINNLRKGIPFI